MDTNNQLTARWVTTCAACEIALPARSGKPAVVRCHECARDKRKLDAARLRWSRERRLKEMEA